MTRPAEASGGPANGACSHSPRRGRPVKPGGGRAIRATEARLKIAGVDETKPIEKGAAKVTFTVRLPAGKTKLQTWFTDGGESRGAYYVYVKRL